MKLVKGKKYICIEKYIIEKGDNWEKAIKPDVLLYCTRDGVLSCNGYVIEPENPEKNFEEWKDAPDWQALRNQAAIAAMQSTINRTIVVTDQQECYPVWIPQLVAEQAVEYADSLIGELQKSFQHQK